MKRFSILGIIFFLVSPLSFSETKKVLCELEGNYSITYEDFRRNYFNEARKKITTKMREPTTPKIFERLTNTKEPSNPPDDD